MIAFLFVGFSLDLGASFPRLWFGFLFEFAWLVWKISILSIGY